ncbi:MAG TPA: YggS family pyridoxal phosphate-dependent enzyme [Prolixibacteraceae bacterium]|nr:YggS family pyridoxal phosphate-dependent enzyme [Prolixibacteraceae bacterium]
MSISENLKYLKASLPPGVKLVAVSKTKSDPEILEAYNTGQRVFGENKVQELAAKYERMPRDIEWHLIGHLQSNKVKYIAPFVSMIHSVDSGKLLEVIDREGEKNKRVIDCLLQFHIALEETKFGLSPNEARVILSSEEYLKMKHVRICGVMGMATFTDDTARVRREFQFLHDTFIRLKNEYFADHPAFRELSMGMSDDFRLAMECGSTMVRIGSAVFGARKYL